LTEGKTYHIKAYAISAGGTVYGEEVICDFNGTLPTLTTGAPTNRNIGAGTATINGTIQSVGDPAYTEKGFVYSSTIQNPTLNDDKKTVQGGGTGQFSVHLTGLTEGNTYYIKAYATNLRGTAYGDAVNLDFHAVMPEVTTQEVTNPNIGAGTATFNGTIQSVGDPAYTERGFVYATTHNPTIDDTKKGVSGSGTGIFSANITNIAEGTIYYVRAYATNPKGTVYGKEVMFNFKGVLPVVTTKSVSGIDATIATFTGAVESAGDPPCTERGFVYSSSANPTVLTGNKVIASGNSTGSFTASVSGLATGTTYYVSAYATNLIGTAYGKEINFVAQQQPFVELAAGGIAVSRTNVTDNYQPISWVNANVTCESLTLGGFTDWRIPTISELSVIYQNKSQFIDLHERTNYEVTDANNITAYVYDFYWSATPDGSGTYKVFSFRNGTSPGYANMNRAYDTDTSSGRNLLFGYYCRCVRDLP
jgi:hypothetical protein